MAPEAGELQLRLRRRCAAALQAYLRRRAPDRFSMRLSDLQTAARDIGDELGAPPDLLDLLQQAWDHLILTGLVTVESMGDGYAWRLADRPRHTLCLGALASVAGGRP